MTLAATSSGTASCPIRASGTPSPQNPQFNNSAYKKLENEWADWVKSGKEVEVDIRLIGGKGERPDEIEIAYKVADPTPGSKFGYDNFVVFENQSGQTFNITYARDMQQ